MPMVTKAPASTEEEEEEEEEEDDDDDAENDPNIMIRPSPNIQWWTCTVGLGTRSLSIRRCIHNVPIHAAKSMTPIVATIRCSGMRIHNHPYAAKVPRAKAPPVNSKGLVGDANDVRKAGISEMAVYANVATRMPGRNAHVGRGRVMYPNTAAQAPDIRASSNCVPELFTVTSP
jgi:hypothetical protein